MPMNWDIEDTEFYINHTKEEWNIFSNMLVALCMWIYDKKVGSYSERKTLEQTFSGALLTKTDVDKFIEKFDYFFTGYSKYPKHIKDKMNSILRGLVGMKVWAN